MRGLHLKFNRFDDTFIEYRPAEFTGCTTKMFQFIISCHALDVTAVKKPRVIVYMLTFRPFYVFTICNANILTCESVVANKSRLPVIVHAVSGH